MRTVQRKINPRTLASVPMLLLAAIFYFAPQTIAIGAHEERLIEVNGAKIHLETDGEPDAPAVLLWNGAGCTTNMWDLVVPRLTERFRVFRFDVRGTGQSEPSPIEEGYSLEQYADDAAAILDSFGIQKAIVWSMAWGSRAAVVFAARHPERVRLLALYDASVGRADTRAQAEGREMAIQKQKEAGLPEFERPADWNTHRNPDLTRTALSAAARFKNLQGQLEKITVPTLVCTGDHDPNLDSSRQIAERIKNADLVVMENVGHGSVLQRPDLTTDIFLKFVDAHEATK